jgi:hypothetical protein
MRYSTCQRHSFSSVGAVRVMQASCASWTRTGAMQGCAGMWCR